MRHRVREVLELALAQQRRQENECVSELEAKAIKLVICINAFRPAVEGRKDISSRFCFIFAHAADSASFQITPPSCICRFSLRFNTFLMNSDFESCVWNWRCYVFLLNSAIVNLLMKLIASRVFNSSWNLHIAYQFSMNSAFSFAHWLTDFDFVFIIQFLWHRTQSVLPYAIANTSAIWIRTLDLRLKTFPKSAAVADMMVVHTN